MSFFKSVFKFLRLSTYDKLLEKSGKYFVYNNIKDIETFQVRRFNEIWTLAYTKIPFYIEYKKKNNLPDKIQSLDELAKFPIITKKEISLTHLKIGF